MSEHNISGPFTSDRVKPDQVKPDLAKAEPGRSDPFKPDPFKPAQPHIPGVETPVAHEKENGGPGNDAASHGLPGAGINARLRSPADLKLLWVGITLASALVTGAVLFRTAHATNPSAGTGSATIPEKNVPADVSKPPQGAQDASRPDGKDGKLPMGPGAVATTSEVARPWSSKRFFFRDPVTLKPVPAMLVRLPGGILWAFSLREPYGSCELEYVTNLKQLHDQYGFTAAYPMVGDPCNKTLFDLTQYGNGPGGFVRGEVAQGSGWRPPMAIELRTNGNEIIAARMEE